MSQLEAFENGSLLKDKYKCLGKLSKGSYGVVYLAEDVTTENKVAVKYIYPLDGDNESVDTTEEAQREIDVYLKLGEHPNIASLIDHFDSFLILEYCEKGDLYDLIKDNEGPKTQSEILDVMYQLIDLIKYCHEKGVYHRDIKPENIFVTNDCQIKLGDWGLATSSRFSSEFDVGSDRYMAPELFDFKISAEVGDLEEWSGETYDAAKADIWSLGICFLNIIFHKNPFKIANNTDRMFRSYCASREVLFDIFPSMSPDLFNVLRHCLTINPENRDLSLLRDELDKLDILMFDYEFEDVIEVDDGEHNVQPITVPVVIFDEHSSFTTSNAKPINISKSFITHQERKPLSIQKPNNFSSGNSAHINKYESRMDLYTPPSKRLLNKSKYEAFKKKNRRGSANKNRNSTDFYKAVNYKSKANNNPQTRGSYSGLSNKRNTDNLVKLDTKSINTNSYIPPNLRNKLKSPAYQAKTFTNAYSTTAASTTIVNAEITSLNNDVSTIMEASFESQLTEGILSLQDDFVNDFKSLNIANDVVPIKKSKDDSNNAVGLSSSFSSSSNGLTPHSSDEINSISRGISSHSSSFNENFKKVSIPRFEIHSDEELTPYIPPHHRPDYDASKYRGNSFKENKLNQHKQNHKRSKSFNFNGKCNFRKVGHENNSQKITKESLLSSSIPNRIA